MRTTPLRLLERAAEALAGTNCYALAGGLASSLYRTKPRLTNDVDIAVDAGSYEDSQTLARSVIEALGLTAASGWIPPAPKRKGSAPIALLIARQGEAEYECSIDFLLPSLPWVPKAVARAQFHPVDFGFATIPTISREDLIIAKAFALENEPNRFQDLDDLQSIFLAQDSLDLIYLCEELERLNLLLPQALKGCVPAPLRRRLKK